MPDNKNKNKNKNNQNSNQEPSKKHTPMVKQYLDIKDQNPDCLLFFRLGDFYELFFDDAIIASDILNIALTKRGQAKENGEDIPMCGVPYHSADNYLRKLVKAGKKIAICEQMETPEEAKKRGAKHIVKREIVRIITPGTITEDSILDSKDTNYLMAVICHKKQMFIAWVDITTGDFCFSPSSATQLYSDIERINPKELLVSEKLFDVKEIREILNNYKSIVTSHVQNFFEVSRGTERLKAFFNVKSLDSFGELADAGISACGSLVEYISITQKGNTPRLNIPKLITKQEYLAIDASTRRNLELFISNNGEKKSGLLFNIDKTVTSAGARLMLHFLSNPLQKINDINIRLDMIDFFLSNELLRQNVSEILTKIPDLERAVSRIVLNRCFPRDLLCIYTGITNIFKLLEIFEFRKHNIDIIPKGIQTILNHIDDFDELLQQLSKLKEDLPVLARDGDLIKSGFDTKLDHFKENHIDENEKIYKLQENYRELTKIPNLKIGKTNILGYYIEIRSKFIDQIDNDLFIHKQTLSNNIRYTTKELIELQNQILSNQDNIIQIELEIYEDIRQSVISDADKIVKCAKNVAYIDVMNALAHLASENNFTRPILDESGSFCIKKGRHPVIEKFLKQSDNENNQFIANDCNLTNKEKIWLITGPNMAGKSTFLRQNAIITILAHMGSYVPAEYANIGLTDRVFSRIGASDDLTHGKSTFMLEMIETATIINHATEKSLVILDEIGRGTATYDGIAIAWSVVEYLYHTSKCRTLFATHYHELVKLAEKLSGVANYHTTVRNWNNEIVFLHKIAKGSSEGSYGIYVGKIAGLPRKLLDRAKEILHAFEENINKNLQIESIIDNLPLFTTQEIATNTPNFVYPTNDDSTSYQDDVLNNIEEALKNKQPQQDKDSSDSINISKDIIDFKAKYQPVINDLLQLNPDNLSAKDALDYLYQIRKQLNNT